jgi:hypothetical protein
MTATEVVKKLPLSHTPAAAWWIPVWVVAEVGKERPDPLERAVLSMVRAGVGRPSEMAGWLGLQTSYLESACGSMLGRGVQLTEQGDYVPDEVEADEDQTETRPAWVVWDPVRGELLPFVLEADEPDRPEALDWPRRPERGRVGRELGWLPDLPPVSLRQLGESYEASSLRVQRIQMQPGPWKRGHLWVPVEHRLTGPVVWRPVPAPMAELQTELDPNGAEGLRDRLDNVAFRDIEEAQHALLRHQAPWLLEKAGYTSARELREEAERKARASLGASPAAQVLEAVREAYVAEVIATVTGQGWRPMAMAWAQVFESLARPLRELVLEHWSNDLRSPARGVRAAVVGPSRGRAQEFLSDEAGVKKLGEKLQKDRAELGALILALAALGLARQGFRTRLEQWDREIPGGLFAVLDKANKSRIATMHDKGEVVEVEPFREQVLALARVLGSS